MNRRLPHKVDGVPHLVLTGLDVDLGGLDAAIPHELLDPRQGHALLVQDVGEGGPEPVVDGPLRQPSSLQGPLDVRGGVVVGPGLLRFSVRFW